MSAIRIPIGKGKVLALHFLSYSFKPRKKAHLCCSLLVEYYGDDGMDFAKQLFHLGR